MKIRTYLCLSIILIGQILWAQVQFEAKVSRTSIALNERLRVDFVMNEDGDNFSPPPFDGFRLVGGPNQSVSFSWVNGKKSFNKTYSYYLMPLQRGNLTIKQASIEIEGQVYKTSPIVINVSAATEQPKDPNSLDAVPTNQGIHLVAEVSKTNPYLNEPITVVYKLYVSHRASVRTWKEIDTPKYNDFWSQNIDIPNLVVEQGKFNGEDYRYVVLRKTILYPQKSGKLEIEPLSLDIVVDVPTNRRDIFGSMIMTTDNKTVSAGSKTIQVKPLPENGKPIGFSGAVGSFDFKVVPSKTELNYGESLELEVSVSGSGNLKLFSLPKPIVPTSLEMYEPVHEENVVTGLAGTKGKILDKYTIIPQQQGNFPIQPLVFSYFDINTNSYKVVTAKDLLIKVTDGPGLSSDDENTMVGNNKVAVSTSKQFKFIKSDLELEPVQKSDFFCSTLHLSLMVMSLSMIPLLILFKKRKETISLDIVGNRLKTSNKLAKKYLSEAKKQLNNKEPFYVALEKSLHNFLKAKLRIETSEMHKEKIKEILSSRKVDAETITNFLALIQNCEFARYAPTSDVMIQGDYEKAVQLLASLEKQLS